MFKSTTVACCAAALLAAAAPAAHAAGVTLGMVNGSFEALNTTFTATTPDNNYVITDVANLPGWRTTASDGQIEVWQYLASNPNSIAAASGQQFAELNANMVATMFQDVSGFAAGSTLGWQFAHRGRLGVDTMRLTITDLGHDGIAGTADDTVLYTNLFSDGNTAWGNYSGAGLQASGNLVRFAFDSVSAAGNIASYGNFVDAAALGVVAGNNAAVPEPSTLLLCAAALLALWTASRSRMSRGRVRVIGKD